MNSQRSKQPSNNNEMYIVCISNHALKNMLKVNYQTLVRMIKNASFKQSLTGILQF